MRITRKHFIPIGQKINRDFIIHLFISFRILAERALLPFILWVGSIEKKSTLNMYETQLLSNEIIICWNPTKKKKSAFEG